MSSTPRRSDLDGLRGLAVLLVVGFHAGIPALRGAFVAVDIFFVLSGFFLATTLARTLATNQDLDPRAIAAKRIWHLLPALVVVLLGTLASTYLYAPIDRAEVAQHAVPVSAFVGNLAFAAQGVNYFRAGENSLLHTWTLGVEFQLALLFPLLVLLFAKWGASRAINEIASERRVIIMRAVMVGVAGVAAVSFTLAIVINDSAPMWAYFGPHTRLWSFCAGALMAFVAGGGQSLIGESKQRLALTQCIALGLLFVPALLYDRTLEYPSVMALAPVGGTLLLLAGGDRAMTALLAAYLTHRLLERPAASALITRAMTGRPLLAAASVSIALACVSFSVARSNTRYVEQSIHRRYLAARNDDMRHDCWGESRRPRLRMDCAFGDADSPTTLALIGDSHASHWLGGLERAGQEHGWRIDAHVMGACPVADLRGSLTGAAARLYRKCAVYQEATMRALAAKKPRAVILSNSDNYLRPQQGGMGIPGLPESVWIEGLRRTYTRLNEMGIEVIVMRGVPWVPFDVPSCLSRRAEGLLFATECDFYVDFRFMVKARRAQDEAARGLPVRFIDMNDRVCGNVYERCTTDRNGMILFTDDNHITRGFSRALGPALGERLSRSLRR